ncbi:MAG: nucleotide exchange factor GrpE [Alphaproteobacteria bacterium]
MSETQSNPMNEEDPEASGAEAPAPSGPDAKTDAKIISLQEELAKTKDQMLRALAEAENSRKRALKERDDVSKYAITGFARDLLNVSDNLKRALDAVPREALATDPLLKNLVEGIEATQRDLQKSFDLNNIRKIDPTDEPFNPNYHEVIFETAGTGRPAGTVIQVIEAGYLLHDRLLRPARVGVAKDEGQGNGTPGINLDIES